MVDSGPVAKSSHRPYLLGYLLPTVALPVGVIDER